MNALGSTPAAHRATRAVESTLASLARALPRGAAASSAALVREEHILSRLAKQFGVAEASLRDRLKALRRSAQAQPSTATRFPTDDIVDSTPTEQRPAPSGWERELIELILAQPESFAELAQAIASEEISCPWTRQVYELAVDLLATDRPVHFETLITTTDDPQIKSLLVDCDEANARRTESDPEQRLRDALAGAKKRRDEARHQSQVATLHQKQLNPEQEEEVLAELFRELKQQQDSLQR